MSYQKLGLASFLLMNSIVRVCAQGGQESQLFIFPIVETGFLGNIAASPRFESTFAFRNLSDTTIPVVLQLFTNTGEKANSFDINLSPGTQLGEVHITFAPVLNPTIPPRISGWGRLTLPMNASVRAQNNILFIKEPLSDANAAAHVEAVKPTTNFQILLVDRERLGRRAALAIVNPSATAAATITVDTRFFQGCPTTLTLQPLNRISRFLDEICGPSLGFGSSGLVEIRSDIPVAVGAIEVLSNGSLATMPVTAK